MLDRKKRVAIGLAIVIAATVTAVLMLAWIRRVPAYPSLADTPDPSISGRVAFLRYQDTEPPCIVVLPASGGPEHEVECRGAFGITWNADGRLVVSEFNRERIVDADTGETVSSRSMAPDQSLVGPEPHSIRRDGTSIEVVSDREGEWTVEAYKAGSRRSVLHVGGPRDYYIYDANWSPDGRWILLTDSEGRLIVVAGDGDPRPRVLAQHSASQAVWFQPATS